MLQLSFIIASITRQDFKNVSNTIVLIHLVPQRPRIPPHTSSSDNNKYEPGWIRALTNKNCLVRQTMTQPADNSVAFLVTIGQSVLPRTTTVALYHQTNCVHATFEQCQLTEAMFQVSISCQVSLVLQLQSEAKHIVLPSAKEDSKWHALFETYGGLPSSQPTNHF